jgi:hypothetical protein
MPKRPSGFALADSSESGPSRAFGAVLYDSPEMKNPANVVAAIGLALGGVFGMLGTMVAERNLQAAFWAVDGVGLVVATALLALKFFRTGNDLAGAGFLVFAIGEGIMLEGTAESLAGSVPSFAAGTALWSAALLLTSIPKEFASLDSCSRHYWRNSLCDNGGKDFLGRTGSANRLSAALFRVPLPGPHVRRLDLDAIEEGLKEFVRSHPGGQ